MCLQIAQQRTLGLDQSSSSRSVAGASRPCCAESRYRKSLEIASSRLRSYFFCSTATASDSSRESFRELRRRQPTNAIDIELELAQIFVDIVEIADPRTQTRPQPDPAPTTTTNVAALRMRRRTCSPQQQQQQQLVSSPPVLAGQQQDDFAMSSFAFFFGRHRRIGRQITTLLAVRRHLRRRRATTSGRNPPAAAAARMSSAVTTRGSDVILKQTHRSRLTPL
jgi:hypothetical protein